jgi:hypothetical protein
MLRSRRNSVALKITLRKLPIGMVDTILDIRIRRVAQCRIRSRTRWRLNWRTSGVVDSITPSARNTAISQTCRGCNDGIIACCTEHLLVGKRPSGGPGLSSLPFTSPESRNTMSGTCRRWRMAETDALNSIETERGQRNRRVRGVSAASVWREPKFHHRVFPCRSTLARIDNSSPKPTGQRTLNHYLLAPHSN